ncbi:MAG: proline--tRNA ligase, partial [Planctomycetota bacterium]
MPCENGEDVIVYTDDDKEAWNIEKAPVDPVAKQPSVEVGSPEEVHTPKVGTIEDVCAFLKLGAEQMIKTLVYQCGDELVLALVR